MATPKGKAMVAPKTPKPQNPVGRWKCIEIYILDEVQMSKNQLAVSIAGTRLSLILTSLDRSLLLLINLPKQALVIQEFLPVHLFGLLL